jgi:hypothetical protein
MVKRTRRDVPGTKEMLGVLLDCVDYREGNCSGSDMVAAVLPLEVIFRSRSALRAAKGARRRG